MPSSAPEIPHAARAIFVGDVTLDLTMVASHVPAPDEKVHVSFSSEAVGGVVANAAVACARAGAAVKVVLQLGSDDTAARVTDGLRSHGIDVDARRVEGRTSRVVVILEPHGEKRLLLDPGVSMFPSPRQVDALDLARASWVHTAVYGEAALTLVDKCRLHDIPWSLDLEPASFPSGIETIAPMIRGAAVVFCNDRAAGRIGDDAVQTLFSLGAKAVIRTLGPAGARYITPDMDVHAIPPPIGAVVDTTGAGDCLAGWFISEMVAGSSIENGLRSAVVAATLSCRAVGAQSSYPDRNQVSEFFSSKIPAVKKSEET